MNHPNRRTRPAGRSNAHRSPRNARSEVQDHKSVELAQRISGEIAPIVEEKSLFLEGVKIGRGGQRLIVKVTVDLPEGPGGVGSDTLTDVSRAISVRLDDVDLVQGAYTLEVSTPGIERVLSEARHFSRAQGRLVSLKLKDGVTVDGRLQSFCDDTVCVLTDNGEQAVSLTSIETGRVRVDMKGIGSEGEEA